MALPPEEQSDGPRGGKSVTELDKESNIRELTPNWERIHIIAKDTGFCERKGETYSGLDTV